MRRAERKLQLLLGRQPVSYELIATLPISSARSSRSSDTRRAGAMQRVMEKGSSCKTQEIEQQPTHREILQEASDEPMSGS